MELVMKYKPISVPNTHVLCWGLRS